MKKNLVLFEGIGELLTMSGVAQKRGRSVAELDLGIIPKGALLVEGERVVWAGARSKLPRAWKERIAKAWDLGGRTVLPGFVECHTHLVFDGDRSAEFELRNQGVSYQEISARGGGILSTMRATRAATASRLLTMAQARADAFVRQGVTTLEAKSGYALDREGELKTLKVHARIRGPRVISTFLGAHALPPEFSATDAYLRELEALLPEIRRKGLARRVDIFVEKGFFEAESARIYLKKARELGFDLAVHADQLTLSGGTDLAVELGARSADHVIRVGSAEIRRLAASETTAVLLPAADLYMKCDYPPARAMIEAGARVALATDFNPGSSPTQDLSLVGLLARLQMRMTLPEVLAALTFNAAAALGLDGICGSLEAGKSADFVALDGDWRGLFYSVGHHPVHSVYVQGRRLVGPVPGRRRA